MAFPAPTWNGEDIDVKNLPTSWVITPDKSKALTLAQMENNACMFTMYFALDTFTDTYVPYNDGKLSGLGEAGKDKRDWTPQAVAAILGNMTIESTINPSRWQNDETPPDPETGTEETGYGLVQWTPYSKYRDWVVGDDESGYIPTIWGTWQNNGYLETERVAYERREELQWIPTSKYNYDFHTFTQSEDDPKILSEAFLLNYERPADPDATKQDRADWADYWYYRVTRPIYGYTVPGWWYWLYGYVFSRKYTGRWYY